MAQAGPGETTAAPILCDIDSFKQFNDTYGHLRGDECLKKVAQRISKTVNRSADLTARYGGEEFAVLLPNTDLEGARMVAERILCGVNELQIPHTGSIQARIST